MAWYAFRAQGGPVAAARRQNSGLFAVNSRLNLRPRAGSRPASRSA